MFLVENAGIMEVFVKNAGTHICGSTRIYAGIVATLHPVGG